MRIGDIIQKNCGIRFHGIHCNPQPGLRSGAKALNGIVLGNIFPQDLVFLKRPENSYIASPTDLDPWCDWTTEVYAGTTLDLKIHRHCHRRYVRQYRDQHLRRGEGSICAMNFKGPARHDVPRVPHRPKELSEYLNYRIDKCGDHYLWGVIKTPMGTHTLVIVNALYATNFMAAHALLGDIIDLSKKGAKQIDINTIYICEPAMSYDLFNGRNVAMCAYGDNMFVVAAATVFVGFIKKLANLAAMVQLGPTFGYLPSHTCVVELDNGLIVGMNGTGGSGKSELARKIEATLKYSQGPEKTESIALSMLGRKAARLIIDDLALTFVKDGREAVFEMEPGHYLRGDHEEMLRLIMHAFFNADPNEPVIADNFELTEKGVNFDAMITVDGVKHNNGRAIFRVCCYPKGMYRQTTRDNTVTLDVKIACQLAPPKHDPVTGELMKVTFVPPPVSRVNPQQFFAALCLQARIETQSIKDPNANPFDIVREGIGTLPPFLIVPDADLIDQHVAHFSALNAEQTLFLLIWNRNAGGWSGGKYGSEFFVKSRLNEQGLAAFDDLEQLPGVWSGWRPKWAGADVPSCFQCPFEDLDTTEYDSMIINALSAAESGFPDRAHYLTALRRLRQEDLPCLPHYAVRAQHFN